MVKQTIQIFARVKPSKTRNGVYEAGIEDDVPILSFSVPKEISEGYINNKKELYKFRFEKVFDQKAKQDEIFENVAKPVINNVLSGYNGTIFAYGQTGSGKTFTITGGAERYIDRGIIPRTLSYMFEYISKNSENEFNVYVSYLEIYNESGYDLLDPKHEAAKLEDLPKVSLMEDQDQNIHLKNLSTHQAASEEDALNLLFLGDTNRMIAETPMNQASTRSHCIFTIHLTSRENGSATVRKSKLHLVDLAGSERVAKTGVNGVLLSEAKYINLSLHFLEQVIVSLSEKNRQHIPYRNSMMTSVLRDSLGGNCMTTMIATVSIDRKNIEESISTCRFAQRVALIRNDAILNEELDPKLMIQKLKREIAQLKDELTMATGEQRTDDLSEEDIERCKEAVNFFLEDGDTEATLTIGSDMRKIQLCFKILKEAYLERNQNNTPSTDRRKPREEPTPSPTQFTQYDSQETKKLKEILLQRDNEINILVNMLKKEKKRAADAVAKLENRVLGSEKHTLMSRKSDTPNSEKHVLTSQQSDTPVFSDSRSVEPVNGYEAGSRARSGRSSRQAKSSSSNHIKGHTSAIEEKTKLKILGDLSIGRQEAFEIYRRDYEHNKAIENNKHLLKQRYSEAKSLGEQVNRARSKINKLKTSIEQHRMSRVMQGLVDPGNSQPDEMEIDMKNQMEKEKLVYKEHFQKLRNLKTEIEHLQHLLEKSKVKLMKDFEMWWAEQSTLAQEQQANKQLPPLAGNKNAWNTPPITPTVHNTNAVSSKTSSLSTETSRTSLLSEASSQSYPMTNPAANSFTVNSSANTSGYISSSSDKHKKTKANELEPLGGIQMTGDAQADADILAFVKARQNVIKYAQNQNK